MPVDWKNPKAFTRLLAAMVAAQDMKLDYKKIASMYGQGATYDSIEGRFRIIKKDAAALKAEVDSGERSEAPASARSTPKKPKSTSTITTPKKEKIIAGRVGKGSSTVMTPSSKKRKGIKEEDRSSTNSFLITSIIEEDVEDNAGAGAGITAVDNETAGQNANANASAGVVDVDELSLYLDGGDFGADGMQIDAF